MRLPNNTQRHAIYGQTGSGKTVVGLWALEKRDFTRRPWYIVDFKGDPIIGRIPRLEEIDIRHAPPKQPGLYVTRPFPGEDEYVTEFMWNIWEKGKRGLFVDEAYMIGRFNKAWNALLTQGRSKQIPVIALSQRPSWLSPFMMSESDFHQVLHVQNPADVKRLAEWIPGMTRTERNFHSQYYDVARSEMTRLAPVPDEEEILDRYALKMPRRIHHLRGLTVNAHRPEDRKRRA